MNKNTLKGQWNQIKGKVKQQWGKLTDNDLTQIDGKKDVLIGKLQSSYGYSQEEAEKQVNQFESVLNVNKSPTQDDLEESESRSVRGNRAAEAAKAPKDELEESEGKNGIYNKNEKSSGQADQWKGKWRQLKGKVKEQWGRLTDDDLLEVEGKKDQLLGKIQTRYGISKEKAEQQINDFEKQHLHESVEKEKVSQHPGKR